MLIFAQVSSCGLTSLLIEPVSGIVASSKISEYLALEHAGRMTILLA
jgi:hypothetical protein